MKIKLVIIFLLLGFAKMQAQDLQHQVSLGYGFPNLVKAVARRYINTDRKVTVTGYGPLHLKYLFSASDRFSVGASINHTGSRIVWNEDYLDQNQGKLLVNKITANAKQSSILGRLNYNFISSAKRDGPIDMYAALGLGIGILRVKTTATFNDSKPEIHFPAVLMGAEVLLGFRHAVSENIGIYSELGLAQSLLQIGVSAKF